MSDRRVGWIFVAVQNALLLLLIFLPHRDDWPTPSWIRVVAFVLIVAGVVLAVVATLRLGAALTPTPVPSERGELTTTGLYRFMRHPIYTAMLVAIAGVTLYAASFVHLAIALVTVVFFNYKANWEEIRLADRYDAYAAYAAVTPRFVPVRSEPKGGCRSMGPTTSGA